METKNKSFWDKFWRDDQGKVVIYQRPNILIIVWAVMTLVAILASSKGLADTASIVGRVALIGWALSELFRGTTYFRRLLGAVVLLITIASIFKIGR